MVSARWLSRGVHGNGYMDMGGLANNVAFGAREVDADEVVSLSDPSGMFETT